MDSTFNSLLAEIAGFKVIDAHEHLTSEADRLKRDVDIFTLFDNYTHGDLNCAGMPMTEISKLAQSSIPLETRWQMFAPYWDKIRHGSYARAVLISIREIYGIDDLGAATYQEISARIKAANKPGLFDSILVKKCNIETVLNQGHIAPKNDPLFKNIWRFDQLPIFWGAQLSGLEKIEAQNAMTINTFEDLRAAAIKQSRLAVSESGFIGFKIPGCKYEMHAPAQVTAAIKALRDRGRLDQYAPEQNALESCIIHAIIETSIELGVPVAVHIGPAWITWIDFHIFKPENIVPLLLKYRDARFDVYHLGIPWHDETCAIAKIYPNVWLNLCWAHIFSGQTVKEVLLRLLDLVPTNKIIGFGGDYCLGVENVFGHLTMARQNIAAALANRVDKKEMTLDQALAIASSWLYSNPKELYKL